MIEELGAACGPRRVFVITPNRSMSWNELLLAYSAIAAVSLGIAFWFQNLGLTLVLPFSGLELLALGAALYITAWRGGAREVITITDDTIRVESGRNKPQRRHDFQRPWTRVVLRKSAASRRPGRLLLCCRDQEVEVGGFLNEQERAGLAKTLNALI